MNDQSPTNQTGSAGTLVAAEAARQAPLCASLYVPLIECNLPNTRTARANVDV